MSHHDLKVLTWNLYLGGDHEPLFKVPPEDLPAQTSKLWRMVQGTFFPSRARATAEVIARTSADVVGLQELARWSVDGRPHVGAPQSVVVYDFLPALLGELAARGAYYALVARAPGVDIVLPTREGFEVHYQDAGAILMRLGAPAVTWSNPRAGHFGKNVKAWLAGQWLTIARHWTSVDLAVGGQAVRLVNAHVEYADPEVSHAQCQELLDGPAEPSDRPVVLVGDFNDEAEKCKNWQMLAAAKFADAFSKAGSGPGGTWGQAQDLRNPISTLEKRYDWILYRGRATAHSATVVGANVGDRTSDGLWPSDHGGVLAHLRIEP